MSASQEPTGILSTTSPEAQRRDSFPMHTPPYITQTSHTLHLDKI